MKFTETLQDLSEIIRSTTSIGNRINQPCRLVSSGFAFCGECFYNLWLFYQHQQQNNSIFPTSNISSIDWHGALCV